MKSCTVFCAGEFDMPVCPVEDELIIAADGGLRHLQRLGITPTVILGDFDSLGYTPEGAQVFPVQKDDTDSMLALRHGLRAGCDRFILYGALDGPRADHTVANYQALVFLAQQGAIGYLVGRDFIVTAIKNSKMDLENPGHRSKSVVANPVVVIMVPTWKAAWRKVSPKVSYRPRMSRAISAMPASTTPTYKRSSSSFKTFLMWPSMTR